MKISAPKLPLEFEWKLYRYNDQGVIIGIPVPLRALVSAAGVDMKSILRAA